MSTGILTDKLIVDGSRKSQSNIFRVLHNIFTLFLDNKQVYLSPIPTTPTITFNKKQHPSFANASVNTVVATSPLTIGTSATFASFITEDSSGESSSIDSLLPPQMSKTQTNKKTKLAVFFLEL